MTSSRAEVIVRFGDTIVATAHVAPGEQFVIGSTPDADAAVDVPVPFAVVEGTPFVTRAAADAPRTLLVGTAVLRFGQVTVEVAATRFDVAPLARRGPDLRALAFGALSLTGHLAALAVAIWVATPEPTAIGASEAPARPTQIARFAAEAQTVERTPQPPPAATPVTTDDTPTPVPVVDEPAVATRDATEQAEDNGAGEAIVPPALARAPSVANGETRSFDPDANAAFDTVKVGAYTTLASGTAAGAQFQLAGENGQRRPVIVVSCDAASCLILGGDPNSGIREALEARLEQITGCYAKYEGTAGKKVELDFGIDSAGKIGAVEIGGVGDYDACVAKIIGSIELGA